jgi:sugar phosphate isomerase/epimerase
MLFGVCCGPEQASQAKQFGWDYVEYSVQGVLKGLQPDAEWQGASITGAMAVPGPAANVLVPGTLKITGPDANLEALRDYMTRVLTRAGKVGCTTLVFGSGAARGVPDGFDRAKAREQILAFLSMAGPIAQASGVTIVVEPLNRGECNIINSIAEGLTYVRELNHPNVKQLLDTYHLWLEQEPLVSIRDAGKLLRHVHVADRDGRTAPGESGMSDYRGVFRILKEINYDLRISVECTGWDWTKHGTKILSYLKDQWAKA